MGAESPYRIFRRVRLTGLCRGCRMNVAALSIIAGLVSGGHALRAEAVIVVAGPAEGYASDRTAAITSAVAGWAADINAAGGLIGQRVRLEIVDDGCAAGSAKVVAEQIAVLKPAAILGHPCSGAALAAAEVYAKADLIYLALGSRHPRLTQPRLSPMMFRFSGREDRQGEAADLYLAARFPAAKVAIVHDGARMNRALAEDVARTLGGFSSRTAAPGPGQPGQRPLRLEIATKRKDYTATAQSLKSADAIVFAGFPMEAGLLFQALRRSGSVAQFLVTESVRTAIFTDTFGDSAIGVKAIAATGGTYPGVSDADWASAAVRIFADAARRTGSLAPVTLASALQAQNFESPLGCLEFSKSGDAELCAAKQPGTTAGKGVGPGLVTAGYGVLDWNGAAWIANTESQGSAHER